MMYKLGITTTLVFLAAAAAVATGSSAAGWDCSKMADSRAPCRDPCFSLQCTGSVETVDGSFVDGGDNKLDCVPEHRQKKPRQLLQRPLVLPETWTSEVGTNYSSVAWKWCCCKRC